MRSSRLFTLVLVVALCSFSTNLFARICHPKQPITCGATTLSHPAPIAKRAVKAAKPHAPVATQQALFLSMQPLPEVKAPQQPIQDAMLCGRCSSTTLTSSQLTSSQPVPAMTPEQLAVCCGPWLPTFPYCAATTLTSPAPAPAPKPQPEKLAVCCGPWLPTFPYCSATTLG